MVRFLLPLLVVLLILSCDVSFDPYDTSNPPMALYSILSAETDTQYVRVFRAYAPVEGDLLGNITDAVVKDAAVSISDGIQTFLFHDTTIARKDTSRYKEGIFCYVAYSFRAQPGKTYVLTAYSSMYGRVSSTTTVPDRSQPTIQNGYVLIDPWYYYPQTPGVKFNPSPHTGAYLVRLFIEYEEAYVTGTVVSTWEVPYRIIVISCADGSFEYLSPPVIKNDRTSSVVTVRQGHYPVRRTIELINEFGYQHSLRRAIYYVVQFDDSFYKYYASSHLFEDRFSVRLDQPDFSSIKGGLGVFGAFVVDSISYLLNPVEYAQFPQYWSDCLPDPSYK